MENGRQRESNTKQQTKKNNNYTIIIITSNINTLACSVVNHRQQRQQRQTRQLPSYLSECLAPTECLSVYGAVYNVLRSSGHTAPCFFLLPNNNNNKKEEGCFRLDSSATLSV
jgi:hypothetical protein